MVNLKFRLDKAINLINPVKTQKTQIPIEND